MSAGTGIYVRSVRDPRQPGWRLPQLRSRPPTQLILLTSACVPPCELAEFSIGVYGRKSTSADADNQHPLDAGPKPDDNTPSGVLGNTKLPIGLSHLPLVLGHTGAGSSLTPQREMWPRCLLAGLVAPRRQADVGPDAGRSGEALRRIHDADVGDAADADTGCAYSGPVANSFPDQVCEPRESAGWHNFWLRIGISGGRISISGRVDAGSAERNSLKIVPGKTLRQAPPKCLVTGECRSKARTSGEYRLKPARYLVNVR